MPRFSALVGFTALAACIAALVALDGCPPPARKQPDACVTAIQCYFGNDAAHDLSKKFAGLDDKQLFVSTYGAEGSCWSGDVPLAHSCEDRCRALLVQDCVDSYVGPDAGPFCADACNVKFAEECQDKGNGRTACPVTSALAVSADGGVLKNGDGTDRHVVLKCSAPKGSAEQNGFGCCLGDGVEDAGCAYEYADPTDCRAPPGNVLGTCSPP